MDSLMLRQGIAIAIAHSQGMRAGLMPVAIAVHPEDLEGRRDIEDAIRHQIGQMGIALHVDAVTAWPGVVRALVELPPEDPPAPPPPGTIAIRRGRPR